MGFKDWVRAQIAKLPKSWLEKKWQPPIDDKQEAELTALVFGTQNGQAWLNLMLDEIYCTVCPSNDHADLASHNAQRAVIHGILQKLDQFKNPAKYQVKIEEEINDVRAA